MRVIAYRGALYSIANYCLYIDCLSLKLKMAEQSVVPGFLIAMAGIVSSLAQERLVGAASKPASQAAGRMRSQADVLLNILRTRLAGIYTKLIQYRTCKKLWLPFLV